MEKINTAAKENTPESVYESGEFKIIERELYEQYIEEDLPTLKRLISVYLEARAEGNEESLVEKAWYIYNFIQGNTKLDPDDKIVAYKNLIARLNS